MPLLDLDRRAFLQATLAAGAATCVGPSPVVAQGRGDVLLLVQELGPNSLDMHGVGSNQTVNGLAWNCYDRLMTYAPKTLADGTVSYDRQALAPELAESWQVAADAMSCTFKLRKDATFHDGTPVTANDVKWSFDRAVSVGGFPTFQMSAGSLEKPDAVRGGRRPDLSRRLRPQGQDADVQSRGGGAVRHQFRARPEECHRRRSVGDGLAAQQRGRRRRLSRGELAARKRDHPRAFRQLEKRAAAEDPAGDRPRRPLPGTRRAMLERGNADISTGFPPKDFDQMIKEGKVKVVGVPIPNALWYVALNTARPPFDNVKLRQAIAWAMPYEQIQASAFFGRAKPMYGGGTAVEQAAWPQPSPYRTDLDRAKALMQEAGFAQGLDTSFALDVGTATVGEPTAVLIQESLAKIGVRIAIEKIPGANWRTTLNKKELPMVLNRFSGWLDYPEYYFFWNLHGNNSIFNISAYKNEAMDRLIDRCPLHRRPRRIRQEREGVRRLCIAGGADHPAQPADPRRRDAEGGRRLRVLVPPRTRLPAISEGLRMLHSE